MDYDGLAHCLRLDSESSYHQNVDVKKHIKRDVASADSTAG